MAVAIVLVILFAAAVWLFGTESGRTLLGQGADTSGQASPQTRFRGRTVLVNRPTVSRANRKPQSRMRGKKRAAGGRMTGSIQRSPDAIGLACGRPISECTRGDDCLCE